jgi:hypothetical protein
VTITEQSTEQPKKNPFTTWYFLLGVAILAPLVVAGLALSIHLKLQENEAGQVDTTVAACERPESHDTSIAGAIPVQTGTNVGVSQIPSTVYGPDRTEGGAPVCFEHSPAGAATAAATMATLGDNRQTNLLLEQYGIDGPALDAALAMTPETESLPEHISRAVGFRITDYTGATADVTVVLEKAGNFIPAQYSLVWEDGDWRWDVPTAPLTGERLTSLTGYNRLDWPEGADVNG